MQFNMYLMLDEKNVISKSLESSVFMNGNILAETSIVNPVFLIESKAISPYNYMYVPDFSRYYFINDVVSVRTNLWRVSCTVDVLMSFRGYIYGLKAIIDKQANSFDANLFLNDGSFVSDSRVTIESFEFPRGFNQEPEYVLATLGPGGTA